MNIKDLLQSPDIQQQADRFARQLAQFIEEKQLHTIVETGAGVSTIFILDALDRLGSGHLYSIDPNPWFEHPIKHPRHTLLQATSYEALPALYKVTHPWDLFLHDSNHDVKCMTYELQFAVSGVNPGGYIACDDYTWGGHNAWDKFISYSELKATNMGSVSIVQKPTTLWRLHTDLAEAIHDSALSYAVAAEATFLNRGGQNTNIQWIRE